MSKAMPLLLGLLLGVAQPAPSQTAVEAAWELEGLERLVGGRWYLGDDSYHTFSWGVGGRSLKSESYFVTTGSETLVAEMTFFYHPGEQVVKGYGVAIDMGIDVFEYSIRFADDQIILDLQAFGPSAPDLTLQETWTFIDDDHYEWVLQGLDADGSWSRQMGGTYERRR